MSTMTGFGGGLNARGSEGLVLRGRSGPTRAPAVRATEVNRARPELPLSPAISPNSRSHEGCPGLLGSPPSNLAPSSFLTPACKPRSTYARRWRLEQGAAPWRLESLGTAPLRPRRSLQWRPPCRFTKVKTTTPNNQCDEGAAT